MQPVFSSVRYLPREKGLQPLTPSVKKEQIRVLLIAPNVSQRMGGEAMKAFHIMTGLKALGVDVVQITHARVRKEMEDLKIEIPIYYLEDSWLQIYLHKLRLNWLLSALSSWLLHVKAIEIGVKTNRNLFHFTSPISPTLPYFTVKKWPVVIGPINGNILHPPKLMYREVWHKRLGALALWPYQKTVGRIFRGKHSATLLVSGGSRTIDALKLAGCRDQQIIETLDSGVDTAMAAATRIEHSDINNQFIFVGRLIRYKACDLVIRALVSAPNAHLHVVGDGGERLPLANLAQNLGVLNRVTFHGWVSPGEELTKLFQRARGFIFPSLAEANGIVIQEAMMIGLPVVAVNWGGPQQLIDSSTGILIEPESEQHVVNELAAAMVLLSSNPSRAESIASAARNAADQRGFVWPALLTKWLKIYERSLCSSR